MQESQSSITWLGSALIKNEFENQQQLVTQRLRQEEEEEEEAPVNCALHEDEEEARCLCSKK